MTKGRNHDPLPNALSMGSCGVGWDRMGSKPGEGGTPSPLKVQAEGRKAVLLEPLELSKLKIQRAVMAIHKSILSKTLR